ncbi:MAG TPA: hypothetical protein PLM59_01965 [Oscillospiraceae bacterium]|jgi:hypothetical protein|nr:hypothetical protein [Oscillospiraceae bacterium]HOV40530.1 hypothetical protein [Oscillospiraceae bacterium]
MKTVSIGMIVEINSILKGKGLPYKIHLHDACGAQAMEIESLEEDNEQFEAAVSAINEYFSLHGMETVFIPGGKNFTVK